jgi:hypothetical protein
MADLDIACLSARSPYSVISVSKESILFPRIGLIPEGVTFLNDLCSSVLSFSDPLIFSINGDRFYRVCSAIRFRSSDVVDLEDIVVAISKYPAHYKIAGMSISTAYTSCREGYCIVDSIIAEYNKFNPNMKLPRLHIPRAISAL